MAVPGKVLHFLTFPTPMNKLEQIQREQMKKDPVDFNVGDTVKVHTRVVEGGKERIQIFAGIIIAMKGQGVGHSFTVRKLSYGEGVERVFPVHTPKIAKVEIVKRGRVRRARLHYLRDRLGKEAVQVKEAITNR
jgi:large subunit ribosomal protein L19